MSQASPNINQTNVAQNNTAQSQDFLSQVGHFFRSNAKAILIVSSLVIIVVLVKLIFFRPTVISVIGTGRLTAKPAKVEMLVTQVDSNPDPVIAIIDGEESINQITDKASEIAGENVKIQKSFYQVTPSVVSGDVLYQVVNVFKVTADDPSLTSDLIKGFYGIGATTVSGVNFIPENRDEVTQEARDRAIKDARKQAKSIARSSGKRVGRIISIGDDLNSGNSNVSTNTQQNQAGDGNNPIQINYNNGVPSEIDIAKSMTVTYHIW